MSKSRHLQNPWLATRTRTGAEYDAPYAEREAAGVDIHGEASLIEALLTGDFRPKTPLPYSVLDAGCGTGRTAIELAKRGFDAAGTDIDEVMLTQARAKAPDMLWVQGDLATVQLKRQFDAIVMAGNVMIYVTPGTEQAVVSNLATHLVPGGLLIASFEPEGREWSDLSAEKYETLCQNSGLATVFRWSTWDRDLWKPGDNYIVSLHQRT